MKYFLVLLSDMPDAVVNDTEADSPERFIDSLIARNAVLLGGRLKTPINGFSAAYVLAADDIDTATSLAHEDPLVRHGRVACEVSEWRLVGINTAAIDRTQTPD
jgi:uncharacterized protein YciI